MQYDTFVTIILFVSGIYQIGFGIITDTQNLLSALIFRILPAIFGLTLVLEGLKRVDWI